jgi:hypothetical protein
VTSPGRHFEGKPFLSQHGGSIGLPGHVFPQQNRLDVMCRPGSAKHLLKPGQVICTTQEPLGHKAVNTAVIDTHGLNPSPLRGKPRPTFCNRPNSWSRTR